MKKGKITKYNFEKGFGWINQEGEYKDIYFHITSLKPKPSKEGEKELVGRTVLFDLEEGKKGINATNIVLQ